MQFIWIILAICLVWLVFLSIFFLRLSSHYNNLTRGATRKSLLSLLEVLLKDLDSAKKDIAFLQSRCDIMEKDARVHIQKVGLTRYNPFKDTGGEQSFILVLADKNDSGIIISGLHSRSGIRWYAKRVEKGKGLDYELSDEEKKALKKATETV